MATARPAAISATSPTRCRPICWPPRRQHPDAANQVYNVAVGDRTTLNDLFEAIRVALQPRFPHLKDFKPTYRDFRAGDVRHSLADITKARSLLGYEPSHRIKQGLIEAMDWYVNDLTR
jgi:UDP-N-acetylglucosamine/UDP-N-acetylgalactosamine 4-epimerase